MEKLKVLAHYNMGCVWGYLLERGYVIDDIDYSGDKPKASYIKIQDEVDAKIIFEAQLHEAVEIITDCDNEVILYFDNTENFSLTLDCDNEIIIDYNEDRYVELCDDGTLIEY